MCITMNKKAANHGRYIISPAMEWNSSNFAAFVLTNNANRESENILIGSNRKFIIIRVNGLFSFSNHNNMGKVLTKIERLKKVRVRYDKTETEKYWIEELKEIMEYVNG